MMFSGGYSAMSDKTNDISNALKLLGTEQLKTAVLVLPLAGTLTAITFDVAYFLGVDMNYFTVFPLQEHVGFALPVAPFAFLATLGAWMQMVLMESDKRVVALLGNRKFHLSYFVIVSVIFGALGWWMNIDTLSWLATLCIIATILIWTRKFVVYLRFSFIIAILYGSIFFAGRDLGMLDVNSSVPTHLLNDETAGRLIRTGERGVLFVTKGDRQVVLFRWDGIKSIKSIKLSADDKKKMQLEPFFRRE